MTLRLPRVWPPCWMLTTALWIHAAFACAMLTLAGMLGEPDLAAKSSAEPDLVAMSSAPLVLAAFGYGMFRVRAFHPALSLDYCEWLATTPWTPAKRLPLGPVHLVGADVVLLGAAWMATWPVSGATAALLIVKVFLAAYSLGLMVALFRTAERFAGYALWFGLGWMLLRWTHDGQFFLTAAMMYGIGMIGFRRSPKGGSRWIHPGEFRDRGESLRPCSPDRTRSEGCILAGRLVTSRRGSSEPQ